MVVDFGGATLDVTAAGQAAIELAHATGKIWEEYREKKGWGQEQQQQ